MVGVIFNRIQQWNRNRNNLQISVIAMQHCCTLPVVSKEAVRLIKLATKITLPGAFFSTKTVFLGIDIRIITHCDPLTFMMGIQKYNGCNLHETFLLSNFLADFQKDMEGEVLPTESNQIPGVTSSGQYERNYLTVFALMPHIDDMHSEDLVQYGLVSAYDPFMHSLTCWSICSSIHRHCHYSTINFLPNPHNRHPIAHPSRRAMGCVLLVLTLI